MTRLIPLLSLVLLAQAPPPGPSPADLYHQGAKAFVEGDNRAALSAVEQGLRRAPDDPRLQALKDLIDQQEDEQDQNEDGQQDEAENSDPGSEGDEGEQGEDGQDSQPDQPEGDDEAERDQTQTTPPDQTAPDAQPPPAAAEAGQMSPEQAERILDAVGGEERLLLREIRRAPTQRRRSDKDW